MERTANVHHLNMLAVEYQGMYRDARGNVRLANGLYHADLFRPTCVFGPGFREQLNDLGFVERSVTSDNRPNTPMISVE